MNFHKEELESGLKSIAKSSIIVFLGVFLSKIILYIYRIIIARYFGPEGYGLFSLALIIFSFFISLSALGLSEGIVRYISFFRGKKKSNEINFLFKTILIISLISSIFFGAILFFASDFIALTFFHSPELIILLKIFSFAIPLSVISVVYMNTLRAYENITSYSFNINIMQNLSRLLFLVFLIFLGIKSVNVIAISYVLGTAVLLLSGYLFCRYYLPEIFLPSSLEKDKKNKIIKEVLNYSWPLMFLGIIMSVFYWVDSLLLGYFRNITEVGFYNAAIPIVALFALVPELFMQLFFPLIVKQFSRKNNGLIKELSKQVGKWIFIFNLPLLILLLLFPGAIINILFGKEYIVAENALRILAFGCFFGSFSPIFTNLLSMTGKSRTIFSIISSTFLINLILNLLLIPQYGLSGAAISTTCSSILLWAILMIKVKQTTDIFPFRRKLFKILIASIIPTIILLVYREIIRINILTLVLGLILFGSIYSILIFLLGGLDENDYLILNSFKNKFMAPNPDKNYMGNIENI